MATLFFDSSALVKRYRQETGTQRVLELLASATQLAVARLTHVEVAATIVRCGRASNADADSIDKALATLSRDLDGAFEFIEPTAAIHDAAVRLTRAHALRAADAIQLACAMASRQQLDPQVVIVAADRELNAAAAAEGFTVVDPTV